MGCSSHSVLLTARSVAHPAIKNTTPVNCTHSITLIEIVSEALDEPRVRNKTYENSGAPATIIIIDNYDYPGSPKSKKFFLSNIKVKLVNLLMANEEINHLGFWK